MLARIRPRLRKFTSTLTFAVLLPIIVSPFGQFLIEVGQEQGFYKQPSERVGAVMGALSSFVNESWVLIAAAFLCGLTAGLWIDYLLRANERRRLVSTSVEEVDDDLSVPIGFLDFIPDGLRAMADVTRIQKRITKETKQASMDALK